MIAPPLSEVVSHLGHRVVDIGQLYLNEVLKLPMMWEGGALIGESIHCLLTKGLEYDSAGVCCGVYLDERSELTCHLHD